MAKLIKPHGIMRPINDGEQRVLDLLVGDLSDHYTVLPHFEIGPRIKSVAAEGQQLVCDVIVIAPHAVYAVEVDEGRGAIVAGFDRWKEDGHPRAPPTLAIERKARNLKSKLVSYSPSLEVVWVAGTVVLASQPASLKLSLDLHQKVFEFGQLIAFLTDPIQVAQRPFAIRHLEPLLLKAFQVTATSVD